ncbi:MAG TPA: DUF2786 domain-containing protein [Motilibacteraceae bacterium]|nr:DUF2786 domain-containing protein [Motilibacteraceae bacterium]
MAHLDRIAALLTKAERTDNPHEAEAFLAKAQQLATTHSIDLALARSRTARAEAREQPESRTITVGEPGKRANKHLIALFSAVARSNDVVLDVAANSTYVIAYGMPSDIEVVQAMWASLATQMTAAAGAYLSTGRWRGETYWRKSRDRWSGGWEQAPHSAQSARAAFYTAFVPRIAERLTAAREQAMRDSDAARSPAAVSDGASETGPAGEPASTSAELVLRRKHEEVRAFHAHRSQARGTWRGYSGSAHVGGGSATSAGRAAASRARLGSATGIGGEGKALPGGRSER